MDPVSHKRVIVGTAGHIDHGKTSLVQRLTGVDTDRLPEEKRRGITIVLGFAQLTLPGGQRIGIVDVPGHERFVKNMVAGAGGIDIALLVVAADEGVMPQTREHIEICNLLAVESGLIALTKSDRVEPELLPLVEEDVRSAIEGTFLENAPIVPCSSVTGEGIERLLTTLAGLVDKASTPEEGDTLFVPIDRCFSMKGFGSVVTGTIIKGRLSIGDTVDILPPLQGREAAHGVKVRSLQVFHESVQSASAGVRAAVNLQGVDLESLEIGQVLVTPKAAAPTHRLAIHVQHLASRKKPLKSGSRVLLHTGTTQVPAGLTLLDKDELAPGESGFALARLSQKIATLPGQRFIARGFDAIGSAGRTVAGGLIIDPHPGKRRRKTEETKATLDAMYENLEKGPGDGRLERSIVALVGERGSSGLEIELLARRVGLSRARLNEALSRTSPSIAAIGERLFAKSALHALGLEIEGLVGAYHVEFPFRGGLPIQELATRLKSKVRVQVVEHVSNELVSKKVLGMDKEGLKKPGHKSASDKGDDGKTKVIDELRGSGLEPRAVQELEKISGLSGQRFRELLSALVRSGEVVNAGQSIYFEKSVFEAAKRKLLDHLSKTGAISTADAKTLFGVSRKFLIPLLEAMDKAQVTVRIGETRKARSQPKA